MTDEGGTGTVVNDRPAQGGERKACQDGIRNEVGVYDRA